jgi:hypothetical protein
MGGRRIEAITITITIRPGAIPFALIMDNSDSTNSDSNPNPIRNHTKQQLVENEC